VTPTHPIARSSMDRLALGGADPAGLHALRAAQLSKHISLLVILARDDTPAHAWAVELLAAAQAADAGAYRRVLGYPYVGETLARAVYESRRGRTGSLRGVLDPIAAAAAVHAGLDFRFAGTGPVHLPSLGSVTAADGQGFVVEHRAGRLSVSGGAWQELRRLPAPIGAPGVTLDDLHPDRAPGTDAPAPRLSDTEAGRWQELFEAAWAHLRGRQPHRLDELSYLLAAVTPVRPDNPRSGLSASSRHSFGAVVMSPPHDPVGLAATLVHEGQHAKFNALLDLMEFCDPADQHRYYAPWRADPRPAESLLNGCYAFIGVADFWAAERAAPGATTARADYEFAQAALRVSRALDELAGAPGLTATGRRFADSMAASLATLDVAGLPAAVRRWAALTVDDHRAGWQLRNHAVDDTAVRAVAAAWRSGRPAPPVGPSRLEPATESFQASRRAVTLGRMAGTPAHRTVGVRSVDDDPTGTGDLELAAGDSDTAVDRYLAAIGRDPGDEPAWVGLSIARQSAGAADRAIWKDRPELIRAVFRELAIGGDPPDLLELAGWLAADGG
jgi:HEXXH motif-containing protein